MTTTTTTTKTKKKKKNSNKKKKQEQEEEQEEQKQEQENVEEGGEEEKEEEEKESVSFFSYSVSYTPLTIPPSMYSTCYTQQSFPLSSCPMHSTPYLSVCHGRQGRQLLTERAKGDKPLPVPPGSGGMAAVRGLCGTSGHGLLQEEFPAPGPGPADGGRREGPPGVSWSGRGSAAGLSLGGR